MYKYNPNKQNGFFTSRSFMWPWASLDGYVLIELCHWFDLENIYIIHITPKPWKGLFQARLWFSIGIVCFTFELRKETRLQSHICLCSRFCMVHLWPVENNHQCLYTFCIYIFRIRKEIARLSMKAMSSFMVWTFWQF